MQEAVKARDSLDGYNLLGRSLAVRFVSEKVAYLAQDSSTAHELADETAVKAAAPAAPVVAEASIERCVICALGVELLIRLAFPSRVCSRARTLACDAAWRTS
jgi:hypothetical protein